MSERRRFQRARVDIALGPSPSGPGKSQEEISNISIGGALVRTSDPLPDGALMDMHFKLPGEERVISLTAKVLRTLQEDGKPAMAVRFEKVQLQDQIVLGAFVTERAWSEELPDAQVVSDEAPRATPKTESTSGARSLSEDVAHESEEWAHEGFVVVGEQNKKLTRDLAEEFGGDVIVVQTKK